MAAMDKSRKDKFTPSRLEEGGSRSSSIRPVSAPGFLSAAPGARGAAGAPAAPGVMSAAPRPGVAAGGPIPPVAAAQPARPSVLPVAGQWGTDLPRLAAMAGIGLVAGGIGLRLRERLFGARKSQPQTVEDLEPEVSDTYLDDKM